MNSIDNSRNYQGVAPTTTDSVAAESTLVPVQPEKPETNPEPVINTYEAFRQQGGERKGEQDLRGQLLQSSLHKQAGTTNTKSPARSRATSAAAPEGAPINHAKVARWQRGYLYDFGRPVTREQAAQWIFEGGKVPDKAKLVEGPGNTWHVQMPQELAGQIEVVKKMKHNILENSHEQINTKEITWVDGPPLPAVVNQRRDLKNDLGFKVAKHYNLDPGQYTTNQLASLTGKGHGYELQFDKPMTRDQIMQTLYEKNNMPNKGDVRLIPVGKEPSQTWQVHVMETGTSRLKSSVVAIFSDAIHSAEKSAPPGVSAGIRAHLENKTVPANAVAHPKGAKHPPGAYVWEQDGHLVYVITDGKGKDGLYHYEVTKLSSNNAQYNKDMRHYMIENGMSPKMALAAFTGQWDELSRMVLGGFAMALASGRLPGKNPAALKDLEASMISRWRTTQRTAVSPHAPTKPMPAPAAAPKPQRAAQPKVDPHAKTPNINNGTTIKTEVKPAPAARAKKPAAPEQPSARDLRTVEVNTPFGREKMTVAELRKRKNAAFEWMIKESRRLSEQTEKSPNGYRPPSSFWKDLGREAQKKFKLPERWEML